MAFFAPLKIKSIGGRQLGVRGRAILKWNGEKVKMQLHRQLSRNLVTANELVHKTIKHELKSAPWGSVPVGSHLNKYVGKTSRPMQTPFQQTGNLANSPVTSYKKPTSNSFFSGRQMRGRTSTEVKYAMNLEKGGPAVYIPQTQKIHTNIRLVNPIPKKKAVRMNIGRRPVWLPIFHRLESKILKVLAR